jgi:hypothetical protein
LDREKSGSPEEEEEKKKLASKIGRMVAKPMPKIVSHDLKKIKPFWFASAGIRHDMKNLLETI